MAHLDLDRMKEKAYRGVIINELVLEDQFPPDIYDALP